MLSIRQLVQGTTLRQARSVVRVNYLRNMSSHGDGRMFSDEEKAKETQYIR
jgi:hypothetical protein